MVYVSIKQSFYNAAFEDNLLQLKWFTTCVPITCHSLSKTASRCNSPFSYPTRASKQMPRSVMQLNGRFVFTITISLNCWSSAVISKIYTNKYTFVLSRRTYLKLLKLLTTRLGRDSSGAIWKLVLQDILWRDNHIDCSGKPD